MVLSGFFEMTAPKSPASQLFPEYTDRKRIGSSTSLCSSNEPLRTAGLIRQLRSIKSAQWVG
jgi:hypothetical protein